MFMYLYVLMCGAVCVQVCAHLVSQICIAHMICSSTPLCQYKYIQYSENAGFAKKLEDNGVKFVGPTVDNL